MVLDLGYLGVIGFLVLSPLATQGGLLWHRAGIWTESSLDCSWLEEISEMLESNLELLGELGVLFLALLLVVPYIDG